jgi:hypothetical protein
LRIRRVPPKFSPNVDLEKFERFSFGCVNSIFVYLHVEKYSLQRMEEEEEDCGPCYPICTCLDVGRGQTPTPSMISEI